MPLDPWREIDVTGWEVINPEPRGKRAKAWVAGPDNSMWLRKEPLEARPTEPTIEATMARLARAVGLEAPETHVCVWNEAKRGLLVRSFLDAQQETLSSGAERLGAYDREYDRERHGHHTLRRVMTCLEMAEVREPGADLLEPFARMLAFDAWVGNGDRHQENWAIIIDTATGAIRLAPAYDTAACLGCELDNRWFLPGRFSPKQLEKYIERCPSGFGDGSDWKLLPQAKVVHDLAEFPVWSNNVYAWVAVFEQGIDSVADFIDTIPDRWLPPPRRAFAKTLLRQRLLWLKDRLP